ncbi:MAG TPA: dehydrogenase E1 component subunit alpha/beta [Acidimicrobiia bacterium]|nr:dehydrogenase E1 component subunit alpha/beta [Acidimicrobiia bacterium]
MTEKEPRRGGLGRSLDDLLTPAESRSSHVDEFDRPVDDWVPSEERLLHFYEVMLTGRLLETELHSLARDGGLPGPFHPGVGQEAAMVGFAGSLDPGDVFGGTHRDLTAQLARGVTLEETLLNVFGKAAGPTRGRDGGSHFGVLDKGTLMVVAALPDAYPVAVGCALAFVQKGEPRVAMANCGEGATATGTWHEAVNTAAVLGLPVVFTVQNNQYAFSTPNAGQFVGGYVAHRADGYGIPGVVVDGNDVLEVASVTREAVERARGGGGPTLIEAVTFRRLGHAADDDAGYMDAEERERWEHDDPIPRFEEYLGTRGLLDEQRRRHLTERIETRIRRTIEWARAQADPPPSQVTTDLFALRVVSELPVPEAGGEPVTMVEAIRSGLSAEMERDERVFAIGQDVGAYGGAFGVTEGLLEAFGATRVVDTPIAESTIVGAAVGAALQGMRPVAEIQSMDFVYAGLDQLVSEAAKYHWKAGRPVPLVVRGPVGAGVRAGPHRSASPEALLAHHPGLKVVVPSTPAAAKGLLIGAIRDPNPVIFLEHQKLYRSVREPVPGGDYELPLGRARVVREGDDVTIVTWGAMVHTCLAAADRIAEEGASAEVVDLQTVSPIDWDTVFGSIEKTKRLVVVQEDVPFASIASEVAAVAAEELFWDLEAPIRRVTPPHTHVPFASVLEDAFVPGVEGVVEVVRELATSSTHS